MTVRPAAAGLVAVLAVTGVAALWGLGQVTAARVIAEAQQHRFMPVTELLEGVAYNNEPTADPRTVRDVLKLGGDGVRRLFVATLDGAAQAAVIEARAPNGYGGPIDLLVGVRANGTLTGVRVIAHQETHGLGDRMLVSEGDWIYSFDGKRLGNPPQAQWAVRKDGGEFDQFTGATITPRAIVSAVRDVLVYVEQNRPTLFDGEAPI
ncbi:MAG: electron transport complex subunit RsxG [Pseudomonadota bacterium]